VPAAPLPPRPAAPPEVDEGRPVPLAELAFEVAKQRDELHRLRAALEAVRASDPEKVRVAVEALRDQELGRQAREIAELRRSVTELQGELARKQRELDEVTEDMIKKEDAIDALKRRLDSPEGRGTPIVR
jgi:uncharacterized coiled-coil protein SlyX